MNHWSVAPEYYRRNLPHFDPNDAPYFVTFRLNGSLPRAKINELKYEKGKIDRARQDRKVSRESIDRAQKRLFVNYDNCLDGAAYGPVHLKNPSIAGVAGDHILRLELEGVIRVDCFTLMANHVHVLFRRCEGAPPLKKIMQFMKGRSAIECNRILGLHGAFWQHESYDHVVREREHGRIIEYILRNPVNAGICASWREYPFTYLAPNIEGF